MKIAVGVVIVLAIASVSIFIVRGKNVPDTSFADITMTKSNLAILSLEFGNNGQIPVRYTCDGDDISPALSINGVPERAVSLVLIMDDPDAPGGIWDHLIVFNIPAQSESLQSIPSGLFSQERAAGLWPPARFGKNSWGRLGYGGPCPPSGTHRYFFKLYALDAELSLPAGSNKEAINRAMEGHVLARAEFIGLYRRK